MNKKLNVAIIGSGISGLTSAYYLTKAGQNVTVFEKNDYIGGHTATKPVEYEGKEYQVDTGFIVFNDWTYPNFIRLLVELNVASQPTAMSFSVKGKGIEYAGSNLKTMFGQKSNYFRPSFYKMLLDILRFNKESILDIEKEEFVDLTLDQYLNVKKYSNRFRQQYLIPMGSAIWSCTSESMKEFSLKFFVQFFKNHGLLSIKNRPQWRVIKGGSKQYIEPLVASFKDRIKLNSEITRVTRLNDKVQIEFKNHLEEFDQVIFACHSNQAINLLSEPSLIEQEIVGGIEYQNNNVVLHYDDSLLPKRKELWSAWNYRLTNEDHSKEQGAVVTYNMNLLQGIEAPVTFCVSLNDDTVDKNKIVNQYEYEHPVLNHQAFVLQNQKNLVNGVHNTWYCGAYWRNGFHEDGVHSALDTVKTLLTKHEIKMDWDILS